MTSSNSCGKCEKCEDIDVEFLIQAGAELRPVGRVKWLNGKDPSKKFAPSTNALFILRGKKILQEGK